jgi:hypothetical protein
MKDQKWPMVAGVEDKGQEVSHWFTQTLVQTFCNMSLRSACFIHEAFFSGKKLNSSQVLDDEMTG